MLEDYKQSYKEMADHIDGWQKLTRSELCYKYLECKENGNPLTESYLSAIIYKFWGVASQNYHSQKYKLASEGDCYNWLIDSVMYVLDKHCWTDPNNSLYGNPNAPEMAINVRMNSQQINYFVALNRDKRKIDTDSRSLDELSEEASDAYYMPYYDRYTLDQDVIKKVIQEQFTQMKYIKAFSIDLILNDDLFDTLYEEDGEYTQFNSQKLLRALRDLSEDYCKSFAKRYNIDENKAIKAASKIKDSKFLNQFEELKKELRNDKTLMALLSTGKD